MFCSLKHLLVTTSTVAIVASAFGDINENSGRVTNGRPIGNAAVQTPPALPKVTAPSPRLVPRVTAPRDFAPLQNVGGRFPWKRKIPATVFWIGEMPSGANLTPNHKSSWDPEWHINYGGFDDPDPRNRTQGYRPKDFIPGQNPFYIALPYNDVSGGSHKPEAKRIIPWFRQRFQRDGKTVLKGQWIAIRHENRLCFAQWEDCGPFSTDDWPYVFGNARPKNTANNGAGLDVSPAVRDYLQIKSGALCDWRFVSVSEVPSGPWRTFGANNHFVQRQDKPKPGSPNAPKPKPSLDELYRQRQEAYERSIKGG